jgi:hypothetical protein
MAGACALAPSLASAQGLGDFSGDWTTTFGAMHVHQDGARVSARYETNAGHISGEVDGRTLSGIWTEDSNGPVCREMRLGTHHWGRLQFRISRDGTTFAGHWGYCDQAMDSDWTGTR